MVTGFVAALLSRQRPIRSVASTCALPPFAGWPAPTLLLVDALALHLRGSAAVAQLVGLAAWLIRTAFLDRAHRSPFPFILRMNCGLVVAAVELAMFPQVPDSSTSAWPHGMICSAGMSR